MVDPLVDKLWLSTVSETIPLAKTLRTLPRESFDIFGFPLLGLISGALCLRYCGPRLRLPFAVSSAAILAHFCISLWEVRGASAAALAAAPVLAAGLALLLEARRMTTTLRLLIATMIVSPLSLVGAGGALAAAFVTLPAAPIKTPSDVQPCLHVADAAPLAALPQGKVMSFIDLGPFILAETRHSVYAAPFHRNNDGNNAMLRIMMGTSDEARTLLHERKADYLAICPGAPEQGNVTLFAPDGLAARLARGESFNFLQPLALDGPGLVKAWKVLP
jgi:hypothetical protein